MADGLAWDDLTPELEGPGVGIRRTDAGGLAICLIRLDAGVRTDPLFAEYVEITRSGDTDGLMAHCKDVMSG